MQLLQNQLHEHYPDTNRCRKHYSTRQTLCEHTLWEMHYLIHGQIDPGIGYDPYQAGSDPSVKRPGALVVKDLSEAVEHARVLTRGAQG